MVANELIVTGLTLVAIGLFPWAYGFGTVGVAASSSAAALQSSIGAVQAGSWFATFTSLGMKGIFVKTKIVGAATGAAGIVPKVKNSLKSSNEN